MGTEEDFLPVSPASQEDLGSSSPWTTGASFRKAKALCGALWLVLLLHGLPLTCSVTCLGSRERKTAREPTIIAFLKELHWRALGREENYKRHLLNPMWPYIVCPLGCLSATPPVLGNSQLPGSGEPRPVPGQQRPAESRRNDKLSARAARTTSFERKTNASVRLSWPSVNGVRAVSFLYHGSHFLIERRRQWMSPAGTITAAPSHPRPVSRVSSGQRLEKNSMPAKQEPLRLILFLACS